MRKRVVRDRENQLSHKEKSTGNAWDHNLVIERSPWLYRPSLPLQASARLDRSGCCCSVSGMQRSRCSKLAQSNALQIISKTSVGSSLIARSEKSSVARRDPTRSPDVADYLGISL